jgi:pSer/pThr/pTyr-binding forkhead associated (FHA) protein
MKRPDFHIKVIEGVDRKKIFSLRENDITIGRKLSAGEEKPGFILLEDSTVSRIHADLHWNDFKKTYSIRHRSRTNPTRVNGKIVEEYLLQPGDSVTMGDVCFLFEDESQPADSSDMIFSGIKLLVVEGGNKGDAFTPSMRRIYIGRKRSVTATRMGEAGIQLDDDSIGEDEALLTWNETEKLYSLSPCQGHRNPKISRIEEDADQPRLIQVRTREFIFPQDLLIIGNNILMVLQDDRLMETFKGPAPQKPGREAPGGKKRTGSAPRQAAAPPPKTPPAAVVRPVASNKPSGDLARERTSAWKFKPGFEIEIHEKPDREERVFFLQGSLSEGRTITLGREGKRTNEIELKNPSVAPEQALLKYTGGGFNLVSQSAEPPVILNGSTLTGGEEVSLVSGDRLDIADSVIFFHDRSKVPVPAKYALEVTEGVRWERGRRFPLSGTVLAGRSNECAVRLADSEVSRIHCRFRTEGDACFVTHLSTTNPTFINGVSLSPGRERPIEPGDVLRLSGGTVLTLLKAKRERLEMESSNA